MHRFLYLFVVLFLVATTASSQSFYSETSGALLGFGGAIAISDGEVFVGSAPIDWPSGSDPAGVVYRYSRNEEGIWAESGRISASDGDLGDEFGRSILVADGLMLVGAPGVDAVYVFEKKDGVWTQSAKVSPHDPMVEGFEFAGGYARAGYRTQTMARVANNLLVTSYNVDTSEGAIHVVHRMGMMWHDMGTLVKAAAWSVASDGNMLFYGTPEWNEDRGGVHVFEYVDDRNWVPVGAISAEGMDEGTLLGRSLAAGGGRLYVGAIGYEQSGAVLVYERDAEGNWSLMDTLQEEESDNRSTQFGLGLALSGNDLLVGARGTAFLYNTYHLDAGYSQLRVPEGQAGRGFGVGLAIEGDILAIGSPSAHYGSGVATIFERGEHGRWAPVWTAKSDISGFESISGDRIVCENGRVNDLFPCDNVDLISMISTGDLVQDRGANLNDIWGWEDPETGVEYVLAGRTDGLSFVDISDPGHPLIVGQMMRTEGSPGSWWRDVKVYLDHAFVVSDGAGYHGMQIFDLTQLRDVDPADMPVDFMPTAHYTGVASSHNIIINEETGFAYAIGSRSGAEGCGGQLHMIDIRDPLNPVFAGCFTNPEFGGTHDAQCVVYRGSDDDYRGREICLNSNGNALIIADVTDKSDPKTIAVATYPNTAYTHQGWLSEDHNYFYMNDELDEMNNIVDRTRTLIWDMSDLDDPTLVNEFYHSNSASDHNLYIRGNYMYQSNYQSGLRILDISDPENPVEFGHFDTAPFADDVKGFAGSWSNYPFFKSGIIAVSSQAEGLFLLRKREIDL